jgi:hypothetical protein
MRLASNKKYSFLGTCKNESLIEELFGSVSELARQVEINNNNKFLYNSIVVKYNQKTDIHSFYSVKLKT